MKHFLVATFVVLFLFSCKKENNAPVDTVAGKSISFFQTLKSQLKDSLTAFDYASLDVNRLYRSTDVQSKGCFVRIALLTKNMATDFVLLKTDTLGNIRVGKMVHVEKNDVTKKSKFQGRFDITSLDRRSTVFKNVLNGKIKSVHNAMDLMEADSPVGEQTLPDCVITCYTSDGIGEGDWYWYGGFFDDYSGGDGGYTYGYSGGGTGDNANNSDNTIVVQVESNDEPAIKVDDYLKCFSTVPDANATYKISIFSDIPVNGNPYELFDPATGSAGHSFIQLVKSSGTTTVQQTIGFYPQTGLKSLTDMTVTSKIVDNAGHEFNASLTRAVSSTQFQAEMNKIKAVESWGYNITTWNCTDFALAVFNAGNAVPLTIPLYQIPGSNTYSDTPQALYVAIQGLQFTDDDPSETIEVPGVFGWVGESHGSCGN